MPKNPSPGLSYKKMANERYKPSNYSKDVASDVTGRIGPTLAKVSAQTGFTPKEPADVWHHYNNSLMDVNIGKSTPMVKLKK